MWAEVLRVLKPGGHLCAFGGTRTYHRMACAIEDAGFEIRDSLHWVYGSGFPKSLDVSKAIDKRGGAVAGFAEFRDAVKLAMNQNGVSRAQLQQSLGNFMLSHYLTAGSQPAIPNWRDYQIIRDSVGLGDKYDELFIPEAERQVVGKSQWSNSASHFVPGEDHTQRVQLDITTAATDAAKQWEGWGTALKPAHEPIVLARRPLIGTVAANVLTHCTGALNIDGARVGYASEADQQRMSAGVDSIRERGGVIEGSWKNSSDLSGANPASERGRWPANVIFDTEAGALLDEQEDGSSRFFTAIDWEPEIDAPFRYVPKPSKRERNAGLDGLPEVVGKRTQDGGDDTRGRPTPTNQNHHPTVKPLALMRWLVKLVTPPGGTVLEPFAGSGTTLMACVMEGFHGIGIEMTDEYLPIIEGRVRWAQHQPQRLNL
jgi:hypothetical protein